MPQIKNLLIYRCANFRYKKQRIGYLTIKDVYDIDLVINIAAETHVDNSIKNTVPFVQTNIVETENLLKLCCEHDIPVLHFSTDEVYGEALDGTYDELQPLNPRNPYSATSPIDHLIGSYQNTYSMRATIIDHRTILVQDKMMKIHSNNRSIIKKVKKYPCMAW